MFFLLPVLPRALYCVIPGNKMWKSSHLRVLHRFLSDLSIPLDKPFYKKVALTKCLEEGLSHGKEFTIDDWKALRSQYDLPSQMFAVTSLTTVEEKIQSSRSLFSYLESENCLSLYVKCWYFRNLYNNADSCTLEDHMFIESTFQEACEKLPMFDDQTAKLLMKGAVLTPSWKEFGFKVIDKAKACGLALHNLRSLLASKAFQQKETHLGFKLLDEIISESRTTELGFIYAGVFKSALHYINELNDSKTQETLFRRILPYTCVMGTRPQLHVARSLVQTCETHLENWAARFTKVDQSGKCESCGRHLSMQPLTEDEFSTLRTKILENVIQQKDIFARSTPKELQEFRDFIKSADRYTMVMDGLNVYYAINRSAGRFQNLLNFLDKSGYSILILGRKHLMKDRRLCTILKGRNIYLTNDLSADDPYLLYAALSGGQGTKFLSNDFMGYHINRIDASINVKYLLFKWMGQSQVYVNHTLGHVMFPRFDFEYQTSEDGCAIHMPYATGGHQFLAQQTDLTTWLCFQNIGKERKETLHEKWPLKMPDQDYHAETKRQTSARVINRGNYLRKL